MMKKILGTLAALMLVFCMAACGKSEENVVSEDMGFDSIAFNGTTLTFPCKVQDVENALKGIKVKEEEVAEIVEPGQKYFGSIFEMNNTSFGTMNMSESPVAVRECSVIMVSTTISLVEQTYDVTYPAGIEFGEKFDKEKVVEILGEPIDVSEDGEIQNYQFKSVMENVGTYSVSALVDAEGTVVGASLMMTPEIKAVAEVEAATEAEEPVETEAVVESEEAVETEVVAEIEETIETEVTEGQVYYVKMLSHNENKVAAIKVHREYMGTGLAEAKDVIDAVPCVIMETTDLELAQALIAAFEAEGCTMDEDMLSSEIAATEADATEEISEGFEGYENEITLYNESFKKRKVRMYTPVEYIGAAMDIYVHSVYINDGDGYLIIGGQPSMGAPKCEDASNILEFYIEQVYERIDNTASESAFQFEITAKEEKTVNEHSMYKYNGVIKKSVSSTTVLEYPFVAYATTAQDTSVYWLLADYSENKDQMELLEKQALTMAESYTVE